MPPQHAAPLSSQKTKHSGHSLQTLVGPEQSALSLEQFWSRTLDPWECLEV